MHFCGYRQEEAAIQRVTGAEGCWVGDQPASHMDFQVVTGLETGCAWVSPSVLSLAPQTASLTEIFKLKPELSLSRNSPQLLRYFETVSWLCEMSHIHWLKNLHQQMENVENLPNLISPVLRLVQESWMFPYREDSSYKRPSFFIFRITELPWGLRMFS